MWWSIEREREREREREKERERRQTEAELQASPTVSGSTILLVRHCGRRAHREYQTLMLIQGVGQPTREECSWLEEWRFFDYWNPFALNLRAIFRNLSAKHWRGCTRAEQCAVMKSVERCQAAANQLCSRRIEIIHCIALKAVEAWVQHRRDFLC